MTTSTSTTATRGGWRKITDALDQPAAVWESDASPAPGAAPFSPGGLAYAAAMAGVAPPIHPNLITLADFTGPDGAQPSSALIADAAGDLFGVTQAGGADRDGTVFEIVKTQAGYASTPTILASFDGRNGKGPLGGLIADAAGDLFGTTYNGGAGKGGTVFEIVKTQSGYANSPTTLVSFSNASGTHPIGDLLADAAGDLFGATAFGGADNDGAVFEIVKTDEGYAKTPTTLVSFDYADGMYPVGGLIADAAGDLFGVTDGGGGGDAHGTVFEIPKIAGGYANAPTTLITFTGANGLGPAGGLIADSAGDLFGTTYNSSEGSGEGTVFEIAKTADGYADAVTTLVTFNRADGGSPIASLIIDAAGNLFGTTSDFGPHDGGTVFEIAKTADGYAAAPTLLAIFKGPNGAYPMAGLIADGAGDLFGTTQHGGGKNDGNVFEITHSGYVVSPPPAAFVQAMAGHGPDGSGSIAAPPSAPRNEAPTLLARPQIV